MTDETKARLEGGLKVLPGSSGYYVTVRCPKCNGEYIYGFVYDAATVGNVVAEGKCRICGERVIATIGKLEPAPAIEDNPIRGWSR